MLRDWLSRSCAWLSGLSSRVALRLDENAAKQTGEWGSSLEYKRRYTNPDAAKKYRAQP